MDTKTPIEGQEADAVETDSATSIPRNAGEARSLLPFFRRSDDGQVAKVLRAPEPLPLAQLTVIDPRRSSGEAFTWLALLLVALPVLMLLMYLARLSWVLSGLLGINLATFVLFLFDRYASHHPWLPRVPETTFLYFIFFGGTPAALVANRLVYCNRTLPEVHWSFWLLVVFQVMAFSLLWLILG